MFLVGKRLLGKSARLLQWLVFFSSDNNLTLIGPLFLQSKLLKLLKLCQVRSAEISAKGSPFHFLLFYRNLQNRTRLKGSIFFGIVRLFSKIFQCLKRVPISSFLIFCNRIYVNKAQRVPFYIFRHYATFSERKKSKISSFL